jgi:NADPH:quinone reductase-like Zn-dependent oxidoreductase
MAAGKVRPLIDRAMPLEQVGWGARKSAWLWANSGQLRTAPLSPPHHHTHYLHRQVAEAHAHVEAGHAKGKVVLKVAELA